MAIRVYFQELDHGQTAKWIDKLKAYKYVCSKVFKNFVQKCLKMEKV